MVVPVAPKFDDYASSVSSGRVLCLWGLIIDGIAMKILRIIRIKAYLIPSPGWLTLVGVLAIIIIPWLYISGERVSLCLSWNMQVMQIKCNPLCSIITHWSRISSIYVGLRWSDMMSLLFIHNLFISDYSYVSGQSNYVSICYVGIHISLYFLSVCWWIGWSVLFQPPLSTTCYLSIIFHVDLLFITRLFVC